MKKKIVISSIIAFIFVLMLCTLFFSAKIETLLNFIPDTSAIDSGSFEIHFIDVGQGDAVAIKFPNNKTMLVDSGPVSGRNNLNEYLSEIFFDDNYDRFDYVFLTHSDIDHSGNMKWIIDNYQIGNFYRPHIYSKTLEPGMAGFKDDNPIYDEMLTALTNNDVTTYFSTDNAKIDTGAGMIEIYTTLNDVSESNDLSPFLIISANDNKVFLSGDAGENIELEMIERNCLPEVELMKLAHHGSKYSNSTELIEKLSPEYVVCSVGENSYGHPASDVLLRLAKFDETNNETTYETFRSTYKNGNIVYFANKNADISVLIVGNVGDYLFLNWWSVVVVSCAILLVFEMVYILPKRPIKLKR